MTILLAIVGIWVGFIIAGGMVRLMLSNTPLFIGTLSALMIMLGALIGACFGGLL